MAVSLFTRVLASDARNAAAHAGLGDAQAAAGDWAAAAASYRRASALSPKAASYHTSLGAALIALGQRDAAAASFRQACALDPRNKLAGYMLAGLEDSGGDAQASYVRAMFDGYAPHFEQHLVERRFTEYVTDYFDKALGHEALATFIRGYVQPEPVVGATVLYIEDSRVVAEATKRMLERQSLKVVHVLTAEDAFALLTAESLGRTERRIDVVLTDVTLKGELNGRDVVERIRIDFAYGKRRLPVLVMTGDTNPRSTPSDTAAGPVYWHP